MKRDGHKSTNPVTLLQKDAMNWISKSSHHSLFVAHLITRSSFCKGILHAALSIFLDKKKSYYKKQQKLSHKI